MAIKGFYYKAVEQTVIWMSLIRSNTCLLMKVSGINNILSKLNISHTNNKQVLVNVWLPEHSTTSYELANNEREQQQQHGDDDDDNVDA